MAAITSDNPTLLDVAREMEGNEPARRVIEIIAPTVEMLEDIPFFEATDKDGNLTTQQVTLATPTERAYNEGVLPTKTTTRQIRDAACMIEDWSEVDKALADRTGNPAKYRLRQDRGKVISFGKKLTDLAVYGNHATNPKQCTGLAARFGSLSDENGANIIDAGGTGSDNTSVYLAVWGEMTGYGFYPQNSKAGLTIKDMGEDISENVNGVSGAKMMVYRTHLKWDTGIAIADWRYFGRIANIDVSDLTKNAATGADLIDLFIQLVELPPNLSMGRVAIYCNRTVRSFMRRQMNNKSNSHVTPGEIGGKRVVMFDEIPIRRVDSILNNEARVV